MLPVSTADAGIPITDEIKNTGEAQGLAAADEVCAMVRQGPGTNVRLRGPSGFRGEGGIREREGDNAGEDGEDHKVGPRERSQRLTLRHFNRGPAKISLVVSGDAIACRARLTRKSIFGGPGYTKIYFLGPEKSF